VFGSLRDGRVKKLLELGSDELHDLAVLVQLVGRVAHRQDLVELLAIVHLAFGAVEGVVVPSAVDPDGEPSERLTGGFRVTG
jgi:hypothetical protein